MELTLERVRSVLKTNLGSDSFIASFITEVKEANIGSACIDEHGTLCYDPAFMNNFISGDPELFALIIHELMHPLFDHYRYGNGMVENIACDAIINAVISTLFAEQSQKGKLFRKIYKHNDLEMILRPDCEDVSNRYSALYKNLYHPSEETVLTTGNVILSLKVLLKGNAKEDQTIILLGNHADDGDSSQNKGVSPEILEKIGHELEHIISAKRSAGYSSHMFDLIINVIHSKYTLRKQLLKNFTTRQKINKFKDAFGSLRRRVSPIPIQLSKGDLVKVAAGCYPLYYHNQTHTHSYIEKGLAIYLDVSGSVEEYLPRIIGILRTFHHEIKHVYLFSNKVVKTAINELSKGHITTTYGTDFNCVAESILKNNYERAVIFTDGYARLGISNQKALEKAKVEILSIIFDDVPKNYELSRFGPAVTLNEMKTII
ncbi:MAG: hypothetical protein ACXQTE_06025 [Methanosarcinaceae archaeon]